MHLLCWHYDALPDTVRTSVQVGNFRVEPPGLFRGRGDHPKMGKLKARIYPRDITINIGEAPGMSFSGSGQAKSLCSHQILSPSILVRPLPWAEAPAMS